MIGDNIIIDTSAISGQSVFQDYELKNTGGTDMNWEIKHKDDGVVFISETSGILAAGDSTTVRISVNIARLGLGNYNQTIEFINNYNDQVEPTIRNNPQVITRYVRIDKEVCLTKECTKAISRGDPHFTTHDRLGYSFQAIGEFILTKSTTDGLFEVQVRTQAHPREQNVSTNQAVALNVMGDRVAIYLNQSGVWVNGVQQTVSNQLDLPQGGQVFKSGSRYSVIWTDGSGAVVVKRHSTDLTIEVYLSQALQGQVIGLLGNADGDSSNDVAMRDGTILGTQLDFEVLYPNYADNWRVSQEKSLFDYAAGESTETFTLRGYPQQLITTNDLTVAQRDSAERICRDAGIVDDVLFDNCVLDVGLTQDSGFAEAIEELETLEKVDISAPKITNPTSLINTNISTESAINILQGHSELVNSVTFSPDGRKVVSTSVDKTVKVWDISTGNEIHSLEGHSFNVSSVKFIHKNTFVSASWDSHVIFWDISTGNQIKTFDNNGMLYSVDVSPSTNQLVVACSDKRVYIWDSMTDKKLMKLEGHTGGVYSVAFSPDGKIVASGSTDKSIILWDVNTGTSIARLQEGYTRSILSLDFHPNGNILASGSGDGIRLWDISKKLEVSKLEKHTDRVDYVVFNGDGTLLASGSADNSIILWDVETKTPIAEFIELI